MNPNIILLGIVSFLTDVSSEMIAPLMPLFLASLGGGGLIIGLVGGLGDSVASVLKAFSGYFSDKYGRRKRFVFAGYGISAAAKLFFSFATSAWHILALRPIERAGKGIRTAPRDAIIADSVGMEERGKGFGLHRAMDNFGAVLGSVIALFLVVTYAFTYQAVFLVAGLVAFAALIPIIWVSERRAGPKKTSLRKGFGSLSPELKVFILVSSTFALANFTYMFYLLKAQEMFGAALGAAVPVALYILFNAVETVFSYPMGSLSDRMGRKKVLLMGYGLFALMSLGFALASSLVSIITLFIAYGVMLSMVDATERALVSDLAQAEYRATALGAYHTSVGIAALPGGIIAGLLWDGFGSGATFLYGAVIGAFAFLMLLMRKAR
jgi:MFS family permease